MKKILFYNTRRCHPAIWPNMMSLAHAFAEMGFQPLLCNLDDYNSIAASFKVLAEDDDLAFSIGNNNLGVLSVKEGKPFFPYAEAEVPHVVYALDVPYNKFSSGFTEPIKEEVITVIDKDMTELLPIVYPDRKMHILFLPLAGTEYLQPQAVFRQERIYDVVFSASVWMEGNPKLKWRQDVHNKAILAILDDVVYLLESNSLSTYAAFKKVLKSRGMLGEGYIRGLYKYFWPILEYIKTYRRVKALKMLVVNGIKVEVLGTGWENVPFADKLNLHGQVAYEDTLRFFSQAKVVFQDNADFGNGAHDRVFTAMLNGAVAVSEYSNYLAEEFNEGKEIFMFDWQDESRSIQSVVELLSDEYKRLSVALSAYSKANKHHRWHNRARRIVEAASALYPDRLN